MASSTHHAPPLHARYPLSSMPQPSREESVRLPSLKDLNFTYSRRHEAQETPSSSYPSGATQTDFSINNQENSGRNTQPWGRSISQAQSPSPMPAQGYQHQQQPQPHHHHQPPPPPPQQQQQQHTPPLSATSHENSHSKYEYSQKHDNGGFLTPGMPLSAQSTPVPGAVNSVPLTRSVDDVSQAKRRRSSDNMNVPRDPRSPMTPYPPQYGYPPPQAPPPPPTVYHHQPQPSLAPNSGQAGQPTLDNNIGQVPVSNHPGYNGYQAYIPNRIPPQPHQAQIPHGNPYPSPGPPAAHQAPAPWEQPSQTQQHLPTVHHSQQQQQQQPPHQALHQPPHQPPTQPIHVPQHLQAVSHHPQPPPPPQIQAPQQHNAPLPQNQGYQPPFAPSPHPSHSLQSQSQPLSNVSLPEPQVQPQQQQVSFSRTSAIVPVQIDTRVPYTTNANERGSRDSTIAEIRQHCSVLYSFANRYASAQQQSPEFYPSQEELAEMSHRAQEVVRLLEEYHQMNLPESERAKLESSAVITPPDDHRPPKRPWEDMAEGEAIDDYPTSSTENVRTTAEQDMETIRSKRATSTAGAAGAAGQPKSKYRKRSRATPPGKCHSCNIRETPEWRRGPDGARTLCNACGLHYAKLQRKRDKMAGPDGDAPPIDLETLRASARAAELTKEGNRGKGSRSQQNNNSNSPSNTSKQLSHTGSFQLISIIPPGAQETPSVTLSEPHRIPPPPQHTHQMARQQSNGLLGGVPPPPWPTTVMNTAPPRGYPATAAPEQLQHQSFLRTAHSIVGDTSPR